MSTKNQLTLISHKLCPYVQRVVIALIESGVSFKRIDIDLRNKPDWFMKISPLGKVPILVIDDDTVLFESAIIAEYVNDINSGTLLKKLPAEKAEQRSWIEFASAMLNNIGQLYNAKTRNDFSEVTMQINSKWYQLEQALYKNEFFTGNKFSLVDSAFAPVFRYFEVFENFVELEFIKRYPKVKQWRKSLASRPSVINAVSPDYSMLLTHFVTERDSYLGSRAKKYLANSTNMQNLNVKPTGEIQ